MKAKLFCGILVLLFSVSFIPACTTAARETSVSTPEQAVVALQEEKEVYTVGYLAAGSFSPFFVAQEKGYFAEQGLQIELQSFRTGAEMIAPLSLGHLDIGAGECGTALLNGIAEGLEVRAVMPLASTREGHGFLPLLVRKELFDSGEVTTTADLKGRNVAVNAERGASEYVLSRALLQGNLTVDDVEMVIIPFPDMLQALDNGAVDAAIIQYPLAAKALAPGENGEDPVAAVLLTGEGIENPYQNAVIYFGKTLLDPANEEVATKFVTALLKADRDLAAENWRDDEALVNAIVKYTNVSAAAIKNSNTPYFDPNGEILWDSLANIQQYYLSRGYLNYSDPLTGEQVIEDTFLTQALAQIGEMK